jgi:glucose-6-phosphate 1-dehydrogenase
LPSLYFLEVDRLLPHDLRIVGVARADHDAESYKALVREQLGKRATVEDAAWNRLAARLDYVAVDITKEDDTKRLAERDRRARLAGDLLLVVAQPLRRRPARRCKPPA